MLYFKYDIFMLQKNAYASNFEMLIKTDNFSITLFSIKIFQFHPSNNKILYKIIK